MYMYHCKLKIYLKYTNLRSASIVVAGLLGRTLASLDIARATIKKVYTPPTLITCVKSNDVEVVLAMLFKMSEVPILTSIS